MRSSDQARRVTISKMRTGRSVLLGAALLIGMVVGLSGSPSGGSTIPSPNIAHFVPPSYRVTAEKRFDLDGSATPQIVVTAVGTISDGGASGFAPSTVLVLAWDHYAKRWTEVFDAAKDQSYQTSSQQGAGPGLVTLTDQGPQIAEVHDQRGGKGDLLYWLQSVAGNGGDLIVGVVHFSNQIATLVYNYSGDEGHVFHYDVPPKGKVGVIVSGKSPKQRVTVTLPWLTSVDSRSQAARNFSFVVGTQGSFDEFQVLKSNQAYVGVGLNSDGQVEYVDPSSPANGILQVGDVVQSVVGSKLSSSSGLALAPLVVDQVALSYPGDTISLSIARNGQPQVVHIKLGQWNSFNQNIITVAGSTNLAEMM